HQESMLPMAAKASSWSVYVPSWSAYYLLAYQITLNKGFFNKPQRSGVATTGALHRAPIFVVPEP
ncbi:MAG: hypothetical protein JSU85_09035, partial [Candidatus Zixiibacteriota bacterium]